MLTLYKGIKRPYMENISHVLMWVCVGMLHSHGVIKHDGVKDSSCHRLSFFRLTDSLQSFSDHCIVASHVHFPYFYGYCFFEFGDRMASFLPRPRCTTPTYIYILSTLLMKKVNHCLHFSSLWFVNYGPLSHSFSPFSCLRRNIKTPRESNELTVPF